MSLRNYGPSLHKSFSLKHSNYILQANESARLLIVSKKILLLGLENFLISTTRFSAKTLHFFS